MRQEALETAVMCLSPMVPHICHVLWPALGHERALIEERWPQPDPQALVQETIELVVQVNGKLRDRVEAPAAASRDELEALARTPRLEAHVDGKEIVKVVVVPGKLVNFIVR